MTDADETASLIVMRTRVREWRDAQVIAATLTLDAVAAEQQGVTDARVRDLRWHRLWSDREALCGQRLAEITEAVNATVDALMREAADTLAQATGRVERIEPVEPARLCDGRPDVANTRASAIASALLPALTLARDQWRWSGTGAQVHDLVRAALFDSAPGQPSVFARVTGAIDRAAAAAVEGARDAG